MSLPLPSPSQIQQWVLKITPEKYFEQFVSSPGLLVLRAKSPRSQYQGMHIIVSQPKAHEVALALCSLAKTQKIPVEFRASYPCGRAWFYLYTSGIEFKPWLNILIHKNLEQFFLKGNKAGVQAKHAPRLRLILGRLNASVAPEDMNLPGLALHQLSGDRKGIWSVKVSGNWRVTFRFVGFHAEVVNYEDYY